MGGCEERDAGGWNCGKRSDDGKRGRWVTMGFKTNKISAAAQETQCLLHFGVCVAA